MLKLVRCDDLLEFERVGALPLDYGFVPFVRELDGAWPEKAFLRASPWLSPAVLTATEALAQPVPATGEPFSRIGTIKVVALGTSLLPIAALLAKWIGRELNAVALDCISTDLPLGSAREPVAIVVAAGSDAMQVAEHLLSALKTKLHSTEQSTALPAATLVTARSLEAMTWLVAKLIAAYYRPPEPLGDVTFHYVEPFDKQAVWATIRRLGNSGSACIENCTTEGEEAFRKVQEACEVLALTTHGLDACARGGGGLVLCGLHNLPLTPDNERRGILGCSQGYKCPRGPYPLALRHFGTRCLMLMSCNGFRPGEGMLQRDFNLTLSFLDGVGDSYCSSLIPVGGGDLAARAFIAAIATGYSFANSILRSNIALYSCGEEASLVGVGKPVGCGNSILEEPELLSLSSQSACVEGKGKWLLELQIADDELIQRTQAGCLRWSIDSLDDCSDAIMWDQRVEAVSGRLVLRLALYRFPTPLGVLKLKALDERTLKSRAAKALLVADRWLELIRMLKNWSFNEFDYALLEARLKLSQGFSVALGGIRYNSASYSNFNDLCAACAKYTEELRDVAVSEVLLQIGKSFWLSNVYAFEYYFTSSENLACPYCSAWALRRYMHHPLHDGGRAAIVCSRCGIIYDGLLSGEIEGLYINCTEVVRRGTNLTVRAELSVRAEMNHDVIVVAPRMSTVDDVETIPLPPMAVWRGGCLDFCFEIPHSLDPHMYFVKCIAASRDEISFASRPIFIV